MLSEGLFCRSFGQYSHDGCEVAVPELWRDQRKEGNELFSSGSRPFVLELHRGPVLSVLWALRELPWLQWTAGLAFCRRESWFSKAVGETLQENVAIVEM